MIAAVKIYVNPLPRDGVLLPPSTPYPACSYQPGLLFLVVLMLYV